MGQQSSSYASLFHGKFKIFLHGFNGSGKQSILEKLHLEAYERGGTILGEARTATINNIHSVSWGLGGRGYSRAIARIRYKHGADVMVIVIDSTEDDYTATIAELFKEFLQEESMKDAMFLVLANKQDVEGARSVEQVATELDFHEVTRSHVANIIGCSAKTGEGMQEAMDWLASSLEAKTKRVTDIHKDEKPGKKSPSVVSCVKGGYHAVKSLLNR